MKKTKFLSAASSALACAAILSGCGNQTRFSGKAGAPKDAAIQDAATNVTVNLPLSESSRPLVVQPGTMVTWVNGDSAPHSSVSDTGVWDSKLLDSGKSYSYTFNQPGTYPYHCAVNSADSVAGTIQVSASPEAQPRPELDPETFHPNDRCHDWEPGCQKQQQEQEKPKPKPEPKPKPWPKPTKPWPQPRPTLYNPNSP